MKCAAAQYHKANLDFAAAFGDDELIRVADLQVKNTFNKRYQEGASQRDYNCIVRREIRRRGLDWKPPERRK